MATAKKRPLSQSADGKSIVIAAITDPGTLIHTAVAGTTTGTWDEIWLFVCNTSASVVTLYIQEASGDTLPTVITLQPQVGWVLIEPGFVLQNSEVVRAYASVGNVIKLRGFVNTITD